MKSNIYIADGYGLETPEHFAEVRLDMQKDLGVIRGWQCGTMVEAQFDCLFHFYDHYLRLRHSAERLAIPFWVPFATFEKAVKTAARNSGYLDALVFIRISRGMTNDTVNPAKQFEKRALVSISVFQGQRQTTPIRLVTREYNREYPDIKYTNYLFAELAYPKLSKKGVHDILYLDRAKDWVLECARKNIGIASKGELVFPAGGILEGITMRILCELARGEGFAVSRRLVHYGDLMFDVRAKEKSVIAVSTTGVIPVEEIDDMKILANDGSVRRLCETFRQYRQRYYESHGASEIQIQQNQG